jgi:hypothetical protein
MNAFTSEIPFPVRAAAGKNVRSLFTSDEGAAVESALLEQMENLPAGALLVVDFSGVRTASEAARRILRRALHRIAGGELADRYLVLAGLGASLYNVDVMLRGEELTAVDRSDGPRPQLRGQVDPAMRDTYEFMLTRPSVTAKMVQEHFGLQNISTATNRLTNLARLGLARRVDHRPVSGGGREYVYAPVQ